jgi:hypothetical protein
MTGLQQAALSKSRAAPFVPDKWKLRLFNIRMVCGLHRCDTDAIFEASRGEKMKELALPASRPTLLKFVWGGSGVFPECYRGLSKVFSAPGSSRIRQNARQI